MPRLLLGLLFCESAKQQLKIAVSRSRVRLGEAEIIRPMTAQVVVVVVVVFVYNSTAVRHWLLSPHHRLHCYCCCQYDIAFSRLFLSFWSLCCCCIIYFRFI